MPALPYGTWPSPVDAQLLVSGGVEPREAWAVGGVTWWSESRPAEGGRTALLRRDADGTVTEALPAGVNARTRVHEYGGGAWWVDAGGRAGTVFFTSWADQRLYRVDPPGAEGVHPAPVPVSPGTPDAARVPLDRRPAHPGRRARRLRPRAARGRGRRPARGGGQRGRRTPRRRLRRG